MDKDTRFICNACLTVHDSEEDALSHVATSHNWKDSIYLYYVTRVVMTSLNELKIKDLEKLPSLTISQVRFYIDRTGTGEV